MITVNEIHTQIALGVVNTPSQVAQLVRKTTDAEALEWAIKHRNTKIRAAAISNMALPIGMLVWARIFETSKTVQEVLTKIVDERKDEMASVLAVIKHYPQLSIDVK